MLNYKSFCHKGFCLGAMLLLISGSADAQSTNTGDSPSQYRIGIVNVKDVFDSYEGQKSKYEDLQTQRDSKQKDIDALSEKITRAKERYEADKDKMDKAERALLEESIEADYGRYKAEFKRLQEDIDRREKKLLESLFEDIHQAVSEVGATNNYHIILEGGRSGRSGVLYFSTTLNMTQQVIDYLNEKWEKS